MALSLLSVINAISPKELNSRRVAQGLVYGQHRRQRFDFYAPRRAGGPLPVVVFIYGGAWSDGERGAYSFAGRALAALGYLVAVPDYRLLPEVEYPTFLADCSAAFSAVVREAPAYGGDADIMALMGHSAGAYNAAMLALDPAYLQATGDRWRLRALVGLSGPYDFYPFDSPITMRTFGAVAAPEATQPVNLASPSAPPAFLGHGLADSLVYPRNTEALAARLRQNGVAVEEKYYPGISHPMTLMPLGTLFRGRAPVLADVGRFLATHLVRVAAASGRVAAD
jgi:acetyl esterase/lipase